MFIMKGYTPDLVNTYYCSKCKENDIEHEVIDIPGPPTTSKSDWGPGLPTTLRKCTGCGDTDGPWVSADIVGGHW